MSQPRKDYNYDLRKITEFDPALIYGLSGEASIRGVTEEKPCDIIIYRINQREDMFNAYYYAQEVVLKEIRKKGTHQITAQDILHWLDAIHLRIARALAEDADLTELAGHYANAQVTVWHQELLARDVLVAQFLMEKGVVIEQFKMVTGDQFEGVIKEFGIDINVAKKFIAMLHKYFIRDDIDLSASELKTIQHDAQGDLIALTKLTAAWHEGLLDEEEKETYKKLAKICCRPEAIPSLMNAFAARLARAWNQCDKNNLQEIAELCHMAFYEITEIHPYFNGNGRIATCLMNLIVTSFCQKSFLMRDPEDKYDSSSSYAQAIGHIDDKPELLRAHIYSRMKAANEGKTYKNEDLKQAEEIRLKCAKLIYSFKSEFPQYDINALFHNEVKIAEDKLPRLNDENILAIMLYSIILPRCSNKLETLRAEKTAKQQKQASITVRKQYSTDEKQQIINKLEQLTGLTGWKTYTKEGLQILLEIDATPNAIKLAKALNATNATLAQHKTVKFTSKDVVLLSEINLSRLTKVQELTGWTKPLSTVIVAKVAKE